MEQAKRISINVALNTGAVTKQATMQGSGFIEAGFLCGDFRTTSGQDWSVAERLLLCSFTFTGCPIAADSGAPIIRARMSAMPPAGQGTMIRSG